MSTPRSAIAMLMLSNIWMAASIAWYSVSFGQATMLNSAFGVLVRSALAALVIFFAGGLNRSFTHFRNGSSRFHFAWSSLAAANVCFLFAFLFTSPGRAMFLAVLYPMMALLFEWCERSPSKREAGTSVLLLVLALFGLSKILLDDLRLDIGLGDLLAIASAFFFAVYMITAKRLPDEERDSAAGIGFFGDVAICLGFAFVLLFGLELPTDATRESTLPVMAWLSVIVFGVLSGLEFLVINRCFRTLTSSDVSMLHLAQPVFVAGLEILFLSMSRPGVYIGGTCVLFAAAARAYLADTQTKDC